MKTYRQRSLFDEKPAARCLFSKAWIGRCNEDALDGGYVCEEHAEKKCSCGRQAIRDCDATVGAFVCGRLMCGECTHRH